MEVMYPICCGLDVHQAQVTACLRKAKGNKVTIKRAEFSTTTDGLLNLLNWLLKEGCSVVGMESTGIYWKPVYHILSTKIKVILGNARDIRHIPGRKTDKSDAKWIAELLAHGLIRDSFIPPPNISALRDLTRTRVQFVNMRTQAKNRIHKTLEDSNIKLSSVVSDVFGKSGRNMLKALISGYNDPKGLAQMAKGIMRRKIPQLELALKGSFTAHHAALIQLSLDQVELFDKQIMQIDEQIVKLTGAMEMELMQIISIPGVKTTAAQGIVGEIGLDMSRFVDASRLASWAGLAPGNNESAGKHRSGKTPKGNKWLRRMLVQCAWAAGKTDSFLGNTFRRLEKRIGKKKAAVAVAHKILVIIYHLLTEGVFYQEERYLKTAKQGEERRLKYALKLLKANGYKVADQQTA